MTWLENWLEVDGLRLASPGWLALLALAPLLLLLQRRRGSPAAITMPSLAVLVSLGARPRRHIGAISNVLFTLAFIFAVLAIARPQTVREIKPQSVSGIDIMLAIDVSGSMQMTDMVVDRRAVQRITAAKKVSAEFIKARENDRLGITAFAGQPYPVSPITQDHNYLQKALREVRLGDIADQGTAIGSAIAASALALSNRESESKIIVLVTDGKSQSGKISPIDAATEAAKLDIKIYTIAIGTEGGRMRRDTGLIGQQFDIPTLTEIAKVTGAEFYRARNTEDLSNVFQTINELEKSEVEQESSFIPSEIFHWPAAVALVFGLLGFGVLALSPPPSP